MTDHTPEPWEAYGLRGKARIDDCSGVRVYRDSEPVTIAITDDDLLLSVEEQEANAARIVACVNACAGIPTKQLGDVKAVVNRLRESQRLLHAYMRAERDRGNKQQADALSRHQTANADALAPFRKD